MRRILRLWLILALAALPLAGIAADAAGKPRRESGPDARRAGEQVLVDRAAVSGRKAGDRWYIVQLADGATDPRTVAASARSAGGASPRVGYLYRTAINGFAAELDAAQVRQLKGDPRVRSVVPDGVVYASEQTVPPGVRRIEAAPAAKNAAARIDGIDERVDADAAVIDTGIDASHPDLNYGGGFDCTGGGSPGTDPHGHGTHVAGTIGALDNGIGVVGVAPGARVHALKVLGADGYGSFSAIICALDIVAQNPAGYDVVNMSLGSAPAGYDTDDGNCGYTWYDSFHQAVCAVVNAGVTVVVAAGNDCVDAAQAVPASYDEAITVASLGDTDGQPGGLGPDAGPTANCQDIPTKIPDDTFSPHSNWGDDVDLIAPGVRILSTVPGGGYAMFSGTSMASPHVAGAVLLWLAKHGPASPAEVRAGLIDARERTAVENVLGDGRPSEMDQGVVNVNDAGPWGAQPPDDLPPDVAILSPAAGQRVKKTFEVQVDATDAGSGVAEVEVWVCKDAACVLAGTDAEAPWALTVTADGREREILAVAVDEAGNRGESARVPVRIGKKKHR